MCLPGLNVGNKDTLAYFKLILFRDLLSSNLQKKNTEQASEDHFVATFFFNILWENNATVLYVV